MPIEYGGLDAFDIEKRYQATIASWILRFIKAPNTTDSWYRTFDLETKRLEAKYMLDVQKDRLPPAIAGEDIVGANMADLKSIRNIYTGLTMPYLVAPILGINHSKAEGQLRWKWIASMPANGKIFDVRWRAWHQKLVLHQDEKYINSPCIWCNNSNSSTHILSSCPTALLLRQQICNLSPVWKSITPTAAQWSTDWIKSDIWTNPKTMAVDTVMTIAKWALWKGYCSATYGKKAKADINLLTIFLSKYYKTTTSIIFASKTPKNTYDVKIKPHIQKLKQILCKPIPHM